MEEGFGGLLKGILGGTPLAGMGISPQLQEKDIVLEITEEQFKGIALQTVEQRAKDSISIEFHEKKMVIRIKLF